MATFRVGEGSFNINDGSVGIGTEGSGHGNLKVEGTIKSTNLDVLGVSTFTRYSGFSADEVNINNRDLTLSGEYSTTGDVVVEDGASLTVGLGSTACIGTLEYICVKNHFSVPNGDTAQRDQSSGYAEGTVRYNQDLGTMEFFNGNEWRQFRYQADVSNSPSGRGRAVFAGGAFDSFGDYIDFVNIATLGNAKTFGSTVATARFSAACSSETRGVFSIGYKSPGSAANELEYITIASEGDSIDFGDSTTTGYARSSLSSSTRGIWAGVQAPSGYSNVIDYIEIASIGNALDFGDTVTGLDGAGGLASPTRGVICGGRNPDSGSVGISNNQFITISSKGNAVNNGDLTQRRKNLGTMANSTRGIISGGYNGADGVVFSMIDYITISSLGNAINFGNLTYAGGYLCSAASQTRGITAGGNPAPLFINIINYVTIATTGNAQDFGDLTVARYTMGGLSDCHGGLGGY